MKLSIASSDRDHAILVCDEDHNDIAEFYHNEHATVGQSYETALALARKLVEPSPGMWCRACGTVSSDGTCDCSHFGLNHLRDAVPEQQDDREAIARTERCRYPNCDLACQDFCTLNATSSALPVGVAQAVPTATGAGSNHKELLNRAEKYININAPDGRGSTLLVMELADAILALLSRSQSPDNGAAMREALKLARKRIEYFGDITDQRHREANEQYFFPPIEAALAAVEQAAGVGVDLAWSSGMEGAPKTGVIEAKNQNNDLFHVWWDDAAFKGFPAGGGIFCVPHLIAWRMLAAQPEQEETDQQFEERLIKQDAGDNLRLIDYIAGKIGLPHNEELSRDNFNAWFHAASAQPEQKSAPASVGVLREALEPFAKIAPFIEFTDFRDGEIVHRQYDRDGNRHEISKDDFRRAAKTYAALSESKR